MPNGPSPPGYCLHSNSCRNYLRTHKDTSNQAWDIPNTTHSPSQSNIAISEAITALLPSTNNAKQSLTTRLCLHFSYCGNCLRTSEDTSNQMWAILYTTQNSSWSNITILKAMVVPPPSTNNTTWSHIIRLLTHSNSCGNHLRTCKDTSNQVQGPAYNSQNHTLAINLSQFVTITTSYLSQNYSTVLPLLSMSHCITLSPKCHHLSW